MRTKLFLIALCVLMAGCGDLFDPAAAVVGDEKITVAEVAQAVEDFEKTERFKQASAQADPKQIRRDFEQGYLSQLIRRAVLEPKAEELGVEITDEELDGRIQEIKDQIALQGIPFEDALAQEGLTEAQLEELVRDELLVQQVKEKVTEDVQPTDEELLAYYEENEASLQESRAQHILVDDAALARDLATQLQKAPAEKVDALFKTLAAKHSKDQSNAKNAGDLGYFTTGQFVPEFEEAANALGVGEVSDPVKTQFGFHIIRITDRKGFEDVKERVAADLAAQNEEEVWQKWLIDAYKDADIDVNPRYGELDLNAPGGPQVVATQASSVPGAEEPSPTGETEQTPGI